MNKFELYRQIREELATHYDKELRHVSALLEEGVEAVVSTNARVTCSKAETLVANGDASKVFRQEMSEAMRLILERYQRSLRKEVEALGLSFENGSWQDAGTELPNSVARSSGFGNGAEKH